MMNITILIYEGEYKAICIHVWMKDIELGNKNAILIYKFINEWICNEDEKECNYKMA